MASNLSFTFEYLIASNTFLSNISVLVPSILSTNSAFFWKYFSFLDCSHHDFQALNLTISCSVYEFITANFIAKNTFCLNHMVVIKSLILSYLSSSICLFECASHITKAFLWFAFFYLCMIMNKKSCWLSRLRQTSRQWQM